LMLSVRPDLTTSDVGNLLRSSARPISGSPSWWTGYGYLDADAAVRAAQSATLPASTAVPLPTTAATATPTQLPPSNDAFASAVAIDALPYSGSGTTYGATNEPSEPTASCTQMANTIWYSFTAPSAETLRVQASSTDGDVALALYTGASLDTLR